MSNTATQTDAEILNDSREQNCYWRRLMNKMGVEFTERVVRVDNVCSFSGRVIYTDTYIEIETEHAIGAVCRFQGHDDLSAVILKNGQDPYYRDGKKAFVSGTWRKRGHVVGHVMNWFRNQKIGNRKASARSKHTDLCCPAVVYNIAMFGRSWTGESTAFSHPVPAHPDHIRFQDAQRIVSEEMKLERLQRELAEAEAKAHLAGVAA